MRHITIGLDVDGTVVTHSYPEMGTSVGAELVLHDLIKNGHKIVLNTMRSGQYLQNAIDWFAKNNIPLYGANHNPDQKAWTDSPKVYADLYIDDAALGAPLIYPIGGRPYIDWAKVRAFLVKERYL